MRVLYVSHNGMLEPLGQSQVLPYLRGLARRGIEFDLFSYELPEVQDADVEALQHSLSGSGIRWNPMRRKRDQRLRVKLEEIARGIVSALMTAATRPPHVVHGRSYLPTAVGDVIASLVPRAKLVFDCRGMLGDEYVDSGHWTKDRREYRLLKRYEARAFRRADGVVVLTDALRRWVTTNALLGPRTTIATIPTCVDLEKFRFSAGERRRIRTELGVMERLVFVYSGSLGGLYRLDDTARFMGVVKKRAGRPITFLVLTGSPSDELVELAQKYGLARDEIIVRKVAPREMASFLCAADAGLAFGKTCFARMGCSPTKLAEYLACGVPLVSNADFGDQAALADEPETCVLVSSFDDQESLQEAADRLVGLATRPIAQRVEQGRRVAEARFGLETVGVQRYERLYTTLVSRC
jgi:glycosyltransferase involved in cell wall biosynthesis